MISKRYLKALVDELSDIDIEANPFETEKTKKSFDRFCNKYIDTQDHTFEERCDMWADLIEVTLTERENAFIAGFHAAELLKEIGLI